MNPGENLSGALAALQGVAESVRRIEAEARDALFLRDDREAYERKLQEKTMLLIELHEIVEPFLVGMTSDAMVEIESGVTDFGRRASQALELSSIFYMSSLLYPEDYKEGDKNDLEWFIDRLRNKYLS